MRYKTLTAFSYHRGDQVRVTLWAESATGKPVLGSTGSTVCFFNPDIMQLTEYKQRFQYLNLPLEILPSSVESYAKPHVTVDSELKTIEELLLLDPTLNKDTKFMCRVTIVGFDLSKGWWYKSCPSCHKAAKKMSIDFECYEHGHVSCHSLIIEEGYDDSFMLLPNLKKFIGTTKKFQLFEDQPPSATATSSVELCTSAANVEKQIANAATPTSFAALEPCAQEIQLPASNKTIKRALFESQPQFAILARISKEFSKPVSTCHLVNIFGSTPVILKIEPLDKVPISALRSSVGDVDFLKK
ncbi:unnamed protein product [Malus baccata var. baccata]